ncbi:MAG: TnsA endonuclease N-terminal domain-containing protein [Bacteroidota bacterium]
MEVNKNQGGNFIEVNENPQKNELNLHYLTKKVMVSFKKSRNIPIKEFSLSGSIVSLKNNDTIDFESSLERDFISLLEFEDKVVKYCHQPIKIYYCNDKKYYVPDFYIEYENGRKEIVEIKYSNDLLINHDKFKYKFEAAREFCKANNIKFLILTEIDIRSSYLENVKFLLRYSFNYHSGGVISFLSNKDLEEIKKTVKNTQECTPNILLDKLCNNIERKAETLYLLWYLVLAKEIKADLNIKLNMNSKIWI